jgi:hypothetical protein
LITEPLLSLLPGGIAVDRVEVSAGLVTVHARSADLIACCPLCAITAGASTVRDWLRRLRAATPQPAGSMPAWKPPSGRRAAWLVVADADEIDETEQRFVDALIAGSAELAHLTGDRMLLQREHEPLQARHRS